MPDSASTPVQPCSTAWATRSSHGSPAATCTVAPEQSSWLSTVTPRVRTCTTVPSKPASATSRFDPPATSSTGSPAASAAETASTSAASSSATTVRVAGPPTRSVVRSASRVTDASASRRTGSG